MRNKVLPLLSPLYSSALLAIATFGCALAIICAGHFCLREFFALRSAAAPTQSGVTRVAEGPIPSTLDSRERLSDKFISQRPFDELVRFSSKVSHELDIDVIRLQSNGIDTEPMHLTQARIRFEVRGDYTAIKSFLIAALATFPGLTLERLSIHHNYARLPAGASTSDAPGPDDNSTIEFIQYGSPKPIAA